MSADCYSIGSVASEPVSLCFHRDLVAQATNAALIASPIGNEVSRFNFQALVSQLEQAGLDGLLKALISRRFRCPTVAFQQPTSLTWKDQRQSRHLQVSRILRNWRRDTGLVSSLFSVFNSKSSRLMNDAAKKRAKKRLAFVWAQ